MIYRLLRLFWAAALRIFFRRLGIDGRPPESGPLLLVANHTNALVDGLIIMALLRRRVTMTAKGALGANPLLALLMRAMGVLEFHRKGDAGAEPRRNLHAIEQCRRILSDGGAVLIFPEGISHSDPQMRPLKTGAARIALSGIPGLRIVPVALHYEAKEQFRSSAVVEFGDSFEPAGDALELTRDIDTRLRSMTVNVERRRDAVLLSRAAEVFAGPFERRVEILRRLAGAPRLRSLGQRVRAQSAELRHLGIAPDEVRISMNPAGAALFVLRELELSAVGLPVALWGWINHALPAVLLTLIARRLSRDRDHWATNVVVPSMVVLPVCYALQIGLALCLLPLPWAALYAVVLPYAGLVALLYRDRVGGSGRRARTFLTFLFRPTLRRRLVGEADAIAHELQELDHDPRSR